MTRSGHRTTRRSLLRMAGPAAVALAAPGIDRAAAGAANAKPNVILILTDDLGWADTSVAMVPGRADSRSDLHRTPALERMAREGMVFSSAYAPSPVCTPSRASIQFGKTPARLRQTVVHDVLANVRGIDCKKEASIAQVVKSVDPRYVTAHFGKWGFPPRSPLDAGYDETDGNTNNADGDWLSRPGGKPLPADDPKRIFSLTRRAAAFMARCVKAGRPFFMQVSHYAVHVQHAALLKTVAKYRAAPRGGKVTAADYADPPPPRNAWALLYAAMVEDLDTGLGQLLAKLDELGIADRTYVIFTSDNGGGFRGNAPLRGGKAQLWEGGIRVPMVVRGPGVRAGSHCGVPVAGWDLLPTVNDLVGGTKPLPDGIDGGSLRALFEGGGKGRVRRAREGLVFHFPWYSGLAMSAIRVGDYKLVKDLNTSKVRLHNLAKDLGEAVDLAGLMPAKAAELHRQLSDYLKGVAAENIDDMRAARRAELQRYMKRTGERIAKLRKAVAAARPGAEKDKAAAQLAAEEKRMKAHEGGLRQLDESRRMEAW